MRLDAKGKPLFDTTLAQRKAMFRLWERNSDGSKDYDDFMERFFPGIACSAEQDRPGDYIGGQWCGMYVGIETDGHTHI